MKNNLIAISLIITFVFSSSSFLYASNQNQDITPDRAIEMLKKGNMNYIQNKSTYPNQDQARRDLTSSKGQHPFATVVACSDSRVPVEILFDRGIGDIFVIRVAGNVADVDEVGSIEYGVDHLATPVLVILGHTQCGAVTAVVEGAELHGSIPSLVDNIIPAAEKAKRNYAGLEEDALIREAVKLNVWQSIEDLFKTSPATRKKVNDGKLKVMGAVYDLHSGQVNWMGSHPDEKDLLKRQGGDHSDHQEQGH